ncbi:hypothetical protein BGZ49_000852 [Haplosporangium sp. Z 27]|nr:hypothetical protein BGZ49_000852 [Haplosporangium sp. Z 27]
MKSNIILLLSIVGASLYTTIDAVPIHQLLSTHPSPEQPSPASAAGRVQIKSRSRSRSYSRRYSVQSSEWYHHDRRVRSNSNLSHISLQGHAVVDDDDDDDGNELLDTETDDFIRPDDDDTIEGQILEEEEDEEEEDLDRSVVDTHFQTKFVLPQVDVIKEEEDDSWVKENGLQEGDLVPELFEDDEREDEQEYQVPEVKLQLKPEYEDAEDEIIAFLSKFGGNNAAADLAAEEP